MKLHPAIVAIACLTSVSRADLVFFDNHLQTFVLAPFYDNPHLVGTYFDPTREPGQNPVLTSHSFNAYGQSGPTSKSYYDAYFQCQPDITIARQNTPTEVWINFSQYRAQVFLMGQSVGPGTVGNTTSWQDRASFSYSHPHVTSPVLGQTPYIGIRLAFPDGFHYGWVKLKWQSVPPGFLQGYTPVAWAYESLPDVPALVTFVPCFANCDGSTQDPRLTANDFQCFLNAFASGNIPQANCDGSTTTPVLTANDFQCFLNAFAAGCG